MVCLWWLGLSWFKRRNICQEIMDSMMGGLVLEFLENQCWSNWGCLKLSKHSEENTHLTMLTRNKTYFQHLSTSFNYLPKYFNIFQNQCLLLVVVLTVSLSFSQQQIEKWKLIHAQKLSLTIRFLRQQLVCSVRVQIQPELLPRWLNWGQSRDPQCKERSQTGHRSCWSNCIEWLQGQKGNNFIILHVCTYIYIHIIVCIYIYKYTLHIYIYIYVYTIYIHTIHTHYTIYIHYYINTHYMHI